ncbi:MAG: CPBP family intramembrane metalloprotease, partial [Candidatus Peribacteraceae bacterium]|nr:CPBP family intramembrane metalloprotease [Candidatus Peribacteraceae bacterium]
LASFGFKKAKWPYNFRLTVVGTFLILAMVYLWSLLPEFQEYYLARIPKDNVIAFISITLGSYYFAEEFFFRGFLLFSLTKKFGSWAIVIQAIPFALFHLGKPTLEIICALFVGLLFGHIAYKTKSFFYPFLIHWGIGVLLAVLMVQMM